MQSLNASGQNLEKNNDPNKEYKITKNKLSIIKSIFLLKKIFNPVKVKLKGINKVIKPKD